MRGLDLHTVCEEAGCPNIYECWADRTATFMILGERCTRACGFCLVDTRHPLAARRGEPARVADAVAQLGLEHAVVTSVARDDLADGGAAHFAAHDRRDSRAYAAYDDRSAHPRLQGRGRVARRDLRRASRRVEPQPRDGGAAAARGATVGGVRPVAHGARAERKAAGLVAKSGLIVGLGETRRRGALRDHRSAQRRRRGPHRGSVPAAVRRARAGGALVDARRVRRAAASSPTASGSPTWSAVRSSARATTRSGRVDSGRARAGRAAGGLGLMGRVCRRSAPS